MDTLLRVGALTTLHGVHSREWPDIYPIKSGSFYSAFFQLFGTMLQPSLQEILNLC